MFCTNSEYEILNSEFVVDRLRSSTKGSMKFAQNLHEKCWMIKARLKVKFTLEQATKADGEQRYSSTVSLTSSIHRGGWCAPRLGHFTCGYDQVLIV